MQDTVYDKFMGLLIEKVKSTPIGDGFDEAVTCGPIVSKRASGSLRDLRWLTQKFDAQISKTQFDKVWGYIELGKQEGAKVLVGGERRTGKGYFVDPTSKTSCAYFDNRD